MTPTLGAASTMTNVVDQGCDIHAARWLNPAALEAGGSSLTERYRLATSSTLHSTEIASSTPRAKTH